MLFEKSKYILSTLPLSMCFLIHKSAGSLWSLQTCQYLFSQKLCWLFPNMLHLSMCSVILLFGVGLLVWIRVETTTANVTSPPEDWLNIFMSLLPHYSNPEAFLCMNLSIFFVLKSLYCFHSWTWTGEVHEDIPTCRIFQNRIGERPYFNSHAFI